MLMKIFSTIFALILLLMTSSAFAVDAPRSDNIESVNKTQLDKQGIDSKNSTLVNSLCTIILVLNGRIARVLAAVSIFVIGLFFFMGKVTWPVLITVPIAFGLIFGARTVAIAILPRAVQTYDTRQGALATKTTSELITQACPELL